MQSLSKDFYNSHKLISIRTFRYLTEPEATSAPLQVTKHKLQSGFFSVVCHLINYYEPTGA